MISVKPVRLGITVYYAPHAHALLLGIQIVGLAVATKASWNIARHTKAKNSPTTCVLSAVGIRLR